MRRLVVIPTLLMVVSAATSLAAQAPDSSRVRVTTQGGARIVGTLLSTRGDSVRVRPEGRTDSIVLPFDSVAAMNVSEGGQRHVTRGLLAGGGLGMLVGATWAYLAYEPCTSWCIMDYGAGGDAFFGGVLGLAVGSVAGAAVGAIKTEEWKPVALARQHEATLIPAFGGGRLGLAASFRF